MICSRPLGIVHAHLSMGHSEALRDPRLGPRLPLMRHAEGASSPEGSAAHAATACRVPKLHSPDPLQARDDVSIKRRECSGNP